MLDSIHKNILENNLLPGESIVQKGSRRACAGVFALLLLVAMAIPLSAQHYQVNPLVSDIPGVATFTDPHLINPWGLVHGPTTPWWTSNNGTGTSTLYNGAGQLFPVASPLVVTVPLPVGQAGHSTPTGVVFNGTAGFQVGTGQPARFIFVTEDGTISGWNPAANPTQAIIMVDHSDRAVYKGAAAGAIGSVNVLYVANFAEGKVEVYDSTFSPVTLTAGSFMDPKLPEGYAPFNVANLHGLIAVAYAKQDAQRHDEVAGPGKGFVTLYDASGTLMMRLKKGRWMDAPWGITLASSNFGKFSNDILVGNFGSGRIAVFDPVMGNFRGLLRDSHGLPVTIDGLWALSFGNGGNGGPLDTLYFTAGLDDESHGLFGSIVALPNGDTDQDGSSDQDGPDD
jgi:uncharacterized protein (TIGR03118 family)